MAHNLISQTGKVVHAPATPDQAVTYLTACLPLGRQGARQPWFRWVDAEVTCKNCLKAMPASKPAEVSKLAKLSPAMTDAILNAEADMNGVALLIGVHPRTMQALEDRGLIYPYGNAGDYRLSADGWTVRLELLGYTPALPTTEPVPAEAQPASNAPTFEPGFAYDRSGATSERRIHGQSTDERTGAVSFRWSRTIRGIRYSFSLITMPDGEIRWTASRYNGYGAQPVFGQSRDDAMSSGMRFGCAWSPTHFITRRPVEPVPAGWEDALMSTPDAAPAEARPVTVQTRYLQPGMAVVPTGGTWATPRTVVSVRPYAFNDWGILFTDGEVITHSAWREWTVVDTAPLPAVLAEVAPAGWDKVGTSTEDDQRLDYQVAIEVRRARFWQTIAVNLTYADAQALVARRQSTNDRQGQHYRFIDSTTGAVVTVAPPVTVAA